MSQLAVFNPHEAQNAPGRFDKIALWGESSASRGPYISTDKGMFQAIVDGQPLGIRQSYVDCVILAQFPEGRASTNQ